MDDFVNAKAKAESEEKFLRSFSQNSWKKKISHYKEQQRDDDYDDDEAKIG